MHRILPTSPSWRIVTQFLLLWVLSLGVVWSHMRAFPQFSLFDEATHVDYVVTLGALDLPRLGEPYHQEVLREWSCRGAYTPEVQLPPCGLEHYEHGEFPARGVQRNTTAPLYYLITAAASQPVVRLFDLAPLEPARLVGSAFLAMGSMTAVLMARRLGARTRTAWVLGVCMPLAMPTVLVATSTVTSDAGVYGFSGLLALLALRYVDGTGARWHLMLGAVALGLTKQTAIVGVVAAAAILTAVALRDRWGDWPGLAREVGLGACMCAAAIGAAYGWTFFMEARAPDGWTNPIGIGNSVPVEGLFLDEALLTSLHLLPPVKLQWVPSALAVRAQQPWAAALELLVLMGAGAAVVADDLRQRALGWALLAGGIGGAVLIQLGLALSSRHSYFPTINIRYAVGLVPVGVALVILFVDARPATRLLAAPIAVGSVALYAASVF